ncbi:hypothetical protein ACI6Q5_19500 [Xanthomonas codiaei]|uniref:Uncharacterized protein n=1 Tax=Xanthomonas codiaei TaxID=56463 RepID=A0ABW9MSB1_9XANT|nr:hypothetical protein [Xanthomonas codiaei]
MPYQPHPHHRSVAYANQKSQWLISILDENNCYNKAVYSGWLANQSYWGLHIQGITPAILGASPSNAKLFIAKFVGTDDNWHGYPVAHWLSPFDKPAITVLQAWNDDGYINRAAKAKIHRGKKWNP